MTIEERIEAAQKLIEEVKAELAAMTAARRTLEEIEGLAENNAALIAALPDLLAIAQGQREEIARLQANASTAAFDKINDQLREANRENEELRGLLGNAGQADIERQYCNRNP